MKISHSVHIWLDHYSSIGIAQLVQQFHTGYCISRSQLFLNWILNGSWNSMNWLLLQMAIDGSEAASLVLMPRAVELKQNPLNILQFNFKPTASAMWNTVYSVQNMNWYEIPKLALPSFYYHELTSGINNCNIVRFCFPAYKHCHEHNYQQHEVDMKWIASECKQKKNNLKTTNEDEKWCNQTNT